MKNLPLALLLTLCAPFFLTAQTTAAIDATFGVNGVATIKFSSHGPSKAWAAEVAPDGKLLFVGNITHVPQTFPFVNRYHPNGTLDSLFGDNGRLIYRKFQPERIKTLSNGKILLFGASQVARLNADGSEDEGFSGAFPAGIWPAERLLAQPDGKLLRPCQGEMAPFNQYCVGRYSEDLSPDPTFGINGLAYLNAPAAGFAHDVALRPDGKIVAIGINAQNRRMLAQFLPDGTLDPTFGTDGTFTWGDTTEAYVAAGDRVLLQPDGKILVAGATATFDSFSQTWVEAAVGLFRFEENGLPDAGFGSAGLATPYWSERFFDIFLQNDGKIQVAAGDWSGEYIFQALPDGALDLDFEIEYLTNNNPYQQGELALAQQPDGKLAVATSPRQQVPMAVYPPRMEVFRLLPNAQRDLDFGNNGYVSSITPSVGAGYADGMAVQPDGKLLLWGTSSTFMLDYNYYNWFTYPFAARFNADGSRDLNWGISPSELFANYSPNNTSIHFQELTPLPDGKTLLAYSHNGSKIARFKMDSSVDSTFGVNGVLALPNAVYINKMLAQPDGKIVVATIAQGGNTAIFRFLQDGSGLDLSFGTAGSTSFGIVSVTAGLEILSDGKIVLCDGLGRMFRLTATGAPDIGFGNGGAIHLPAQMNRVAVQPDGKILFAGKRLDNSMASVGVGRVMADGNGWDPTFGQEGFAPLAANVCVSVEVQPDGKIVATGSADQSLVVSRWLSNGQPDATFGNNGLSVSEASPYFTSPLVVALQPNGKIVAASNMGTLNGSQVTIVRFLTGSTIGTSEQVFPRAARMASPNPFSEFLRLDFSTLPAVPSEVAVFDLNGRRVFVAHEISAQSTDIQEVASWQPGVYLLRATTPRGTFVQKIVKQ